MRIKFHKAAGQILTFLGVEQKTNPDTNPDTDSASEPVHTVLDSSTPKVVAAEVNQTITKEQKQSNGERIHEILTNSSSDLDASEKLKTFLNTEFPEFNLHEQSDIRKMIVFAAEFGMDVLSFDKTPLQVTFEKDWIESARILIQYCANKEALTKLVYQKRQEESKIADVKQEAMPSLDNPAGETSIMDDSKAEASKLEASELKVRTDEEAIQEIQSGEISHSRNSSLTSWEGGLGDDFNMEMFKLERWNALLTAGSITISSLATTPVPSPRPSGIRTYGSNHSEAGLLLFPCTPKSLASSPMPSPSSSGTTSTEFTFAQL